MAGVREASARNLTETAERPELVADSAAKWYACHTRSRHEKQVDLLLGRRGIESYLPLVPRKRKWKDRSKVVQLPLFPGYVFGRFSLRELHQVLGTPGVATVVKSSGQPVAIPEEELQNVRRFAAALTRQEIELELRPYVAEGQWVQVIDGPFEGVRGIVLERRGRRRVLIGLEAVGQGLEIDVETRSLRPISGP